MDWLLEHIEKFEPGASIADTTHVCETCAPYLDAARPRKELASFMTTDEVRGKGFSRIAGNFGANPDEFDPLQITSMCGLWIPPEYLAECDLWPENATEEVIRVSIAYASEVLNKLIGSQFPGICERTVHPGSPYGDRSRWANRVIDCPPGKYSNSILPLDDPCMQVWTEGCSEDTIRLPGPIHSVAEVVINGRVLPRDSYYIQDKAFLVRCDGEKWPTGNNCMKRSPYQIWPPEIREEDHAVHRPKDWQDVLAADLGVVEDSPFSRYDNSSKTLGIQESNTNNWLVNFLSHNPEVFEPVTRDDSTWLDHFMREQGVVPVRVASSDDDTSWCLTTADINKLQTSLSCHVCRDRHDYGSKCPACGTRLAAVYHDPSTGQPVPKWFEKALLSQDEIHLETDGNWLAATADRCGIPVDLSSCIIPDNLLSICSYQCGNDPHPIDLSYLNHGEEWDVADLTLTACCPDQGNVILQVFEPLLGQVGPESFHIAIEAISSRVEEETVELEDLELDTAGVSVPKWALEILEGEQDEYDQEFPTVTAWIDSLLDQRAPIQVQDFFRNWLSSTQASSDGLPSAPPNIPTSQTVHYLGDGQDGVEICPPGHDDGTVSWAIRYYAGREPSEAAKVAAAFLAKEIATSLCSTGSCFTSRYLSRLTIDQSADFRWPDLMQSIEQGRTGFLEVDLFIKACNPSGLTRTGYGFSATRFARSRKFHQANRSGVY